MARPEAPLKGRGATYNPENRFRREQREPVDDGWLGTAEATGDRGEEDAPPRLKTVVRIQQARTIIARNDSPDIPFNQSINPYQGCEHGCIYCYARPSHAYLDLSPVIPQLTDKDLESILEAAAAAGATHAGHILLRLPREVAPLFRAWLDAHYPLRAAHVMSIVQDIRGGRDNDPRFGSRMRGQGNYAELIHKRFEIACRRLGLNAKRNVPLDTTLFRPPHLAGQLDLF